MRSLAAAPRRSQFRHALLAAMFAALAAMPATAATVDPAVRQAIAESANQNTYVVVMLAPIAGTLAAVEAEVPKLQARVLSGIPAADFAPVYRYRTFAAMSGIVTAAGLDRLEANPAVESVRLDATGEGALASSVPYIGANQTFALGVTGESTTVAVLDTGIDTDHPDLVDDVAPGAFHFLGGGADVGAGAEDDNGHGSNVSGIITSAGVVSSRGVAPDAQILAIKVLDASSSGFLSDWAAGVDYVVANRASYSNLVAINMSLVSFTLYSQCSCDGFEPALQAAINAAKSVGISTFASSGNRGSSGSMPAPACNSAAFPVAAVYDENLAREPNSGTYSGSFGSGFANCFDNTTVPGQITCFSSRNACNQIAAPGRLITAAFPGGGIGTYTGTSQASPHAAAVAALVAETRLDYGLPLHLPDPLLSLLKATGSFATDPLNVQPIPKVINALLAVNFAAPPLVAAVYPNGGEELTIGSPATILWNASDNVAVTQVELAYSTTGVAGPFTTIASGLPNTGSFAWTVAGPATTDARLRVTARDAASNAPTDASDASFTIADVAGVEDQTRAALAFAAVAPNPSRGRTAVEFTIPRRGEVSLRLLDLQGRVVATLASGELAPGLHRAEWSGIGVRGKAAAGLYFLELRAAGEVRSRRLVLAP